MLKVGHVPIGRTRRFSENITPSWSVLVDVHRGSMGGSLEVRRIVVAQSLPFTLVDVVRGAAPRSRSAQGTLRFASRLAGSRRSHLAGEWAAVLLGSPEDGLSLSSRQQMGLALGFLLASLRFRLRDTVRPVWRPVDWTLRVPGRTNATITLLVSAQALFIVRGDGLGALVAEVWEPCGIFGASLYALAHWLRHVRGIELAASPARSGDE
jgi:hypothetical protein